MLLQAVFTCALCLFFVIPRASAAGLHTGEASKIHAEVVFLDPAGQTTTDAKGITYTSGGWSSFEPKIYPAAYRGTYALYFTGTTLRFDVALANTEINGNKSFKVLVLAVNRVLETNGSPGMEISPPQEWTVESLKPGESKTLHGSVYIPYDPDIPSGLDTTKIRILHLNDGENPDAGLIKEYIAVWCPPPAKP